MSNVKAGDLAIVTGNPFIENDGAVVSVKSTWQLSPLTWACEVSGRPLVGLTPTGERGTTDNHGNLINMPDKYLRPVSGLPVDHDVTKGLAEDERFRASLAQLRSMREALEKLR